MPVLPSASVLTVPTALSLERRLDATVSYGTDTTAIFDSLEPSPPLIALGFACVWTRSARLRLSSIAVLVLVPIVYRLIKPRRAGSGEDEIPPPLPECVQRPAVLADAVSPPSFIEQASQQAQLKTCVGRWLHLSLTSRRSRCWRRRLVKQDVEPVHAPPLSRGVVVIDDEKLPTERVDDESASPSAADDALRWSAIGLRPVESPIAVMPASRPRGVSFRLKRKPSVVDLRPSLPTPL